MTDLKVVRDLLYHPASADYSDFLITKFEHKAEKDVSLSKMLAKIGPVLGLIGTLISMSPALVGLSTGDISGMAYNMQVVFATTVVGLVISAVGLISMQFKHPVPENGWLAGRAVLCQMPHILP